MSGHAGGALKAPISSTKNSRGTQEEDKEQQDSYRGTQDAPQMHANAKEARDMKAKATTIERLVGRWKINESPDK